MVKKGILILIIASIVIVTIGFFMADKKISGLSTNTGEIIKLGWELNDFAKGDDSFEEPYTNVFLVLNGRKIKIGSYNGHMMTDKDFLEKFDFPSDYLIACVSFYAGAGDQLCVIKKGETILVQWKPFDELEEEPADFQTIKKVNIPMRAKIKIIGTSRP